MGVGPGDEPRGSGESPGREDKPRGDNLLGARNRAIVGIVFAAAYIATFGPRTGWPGAIVSGLLGGIVFFLLLREVDARRRRKRR